MGLQVVAQVLIFLLPGLLMGWLAGAFRPMRRGVWKAVLLGMVAFLLWVPCLDTITQWNQSWPLPVSEAQKAAEAMLEGWLMRPSGRALAENLLVVALVPAVCEECFFRFGLQSLLRRWWKCDLPAVAVAALLFSLAHGDPSGLVPRFIMGLLLGLLYVRTGSVWVNMGAHFANNALVVVVYWLCANGLMATNVAVEGIALPWPVALLTTLAGVALTALVCRHPKFANSTPTTA